MGRIIAIHQYVLKPGVKDEDLERAFREGERRGVLQLPGMVEHRFMKGVKGPQADYYAAMWVFESREAWESLWGTPDNPKTKEDYPQNWKVWEQEILAPLLDRDPDTIVFNDYEELW